MRTMIRAQTRFGAAMLGATAWWSHSERTETAAKTEKAAAVIKNAVDEKVPEPISDLVNKAVTKAVRDILAARETNATPALPLMEPRLPTKSEPMVTMPPLPDRKETQ